jgi:uncharacterized protein (DUF488 family)
MTNASPEFQVLSIGHSNHRIDAFVELLQRHGVTAVADVRSSPYSRWVPQFSRNELSAALKAHGIAYVFLGKEFGARSENPACYVDGKVQYDRLAAEPAFESGVERIKEGIQKHRIALMCAEKDPIDCHRALLVSREIDRHGMPVAHILADGSLQTQRELETRLLRKHKLPENDLLSRSEFVDTAYRKQEERVAYEDEQIARRNGATA